MAQVPEVTPIPVGTVARRRPLWLFRQLGSGLVAGASDNDPTTVATLAVIGSTTQYQLSWLVVLIIPMLVVVQLISAAVGTVAQAGLEAVIRRRYGPLWGWVTLVAILAVNLVTLAADLEGGAAALHLLVGWPYQWFLLPFALAVAALLVWGSYGMLEHVLRYVLLIFVAYIVTAFLAHPDWSQVAHATFIPSLPLSSTYFAGVLALLGTTLTSYAYVWETIQQAEERPALRRLGLVQVDAGVGMAFAGCIFWFIVIGTGATLGVHHQQVQTAQDAANALTPLAGHFAALIFGIGLLASAALAVPVLAGTSAYVLADMFHWRTGLNRRFERASRFYLALLLCLGVGVSIAFVGLSPIRLLFLSSIAGGFGTPITLILMLLVAHDGEIMSEHRVRGPLLMCGWIVATIVTAACLVFLWQTVSGH